MKNYGVIYKITNLVNNKCYIGQTVQGIKRRFQQHLNAASQDNLDRCCKHLCKAIKKYGEDNFIIEEVEKCPVGSLNEREQYWITYFDSYNNGYNLTIGGEGTPRFDNDLILDYLVNSNLSYTELSILFDCSTDHISRIASVNNVFRDIFYDKKTKRAKRILMLSYPDEEPLCLFNSYNEVFQWFKDNLNIDKDSCKNIKNAISNKNEYVLGYCWKYVDLDFFLENKDCSYILSKRYYRYRTDSEINSIVNLYQNGNSLDNICYLMGREKHFVSSILKEKGFNPFLDSIAKTKALCSKRVVQYSLDLSEIINTFASVQDAARLGLSDVKKSNHISACCNGRRKSAYGYVWKFAE